MAEINKTPLKSQSERKRPPVEIPTLENFLNVGAHFGHKSSRWHPKMKPYIYTDRNGVHIIDLVKSMKLLKEALAVIQQASDKGSVLIVGTKGQASTMVEKVANEVGAFYINNRWPGGLFTNFQMIKKSVEKLIKMEESLASGAEELVKKEVLMLAKEIERLNKLYEGIKFMDKLPSLVIIIDSKVEKNAIKEALATGVTTVALIDTNCNPELVKHPIPANDDSIRSINLFLDLFGSAIKGGLKADSLLALRKSYFAKLNALQAEYENRLAMKEKMEEEQRERLRRLRTGEEVVIEEGSAVISRVKDGGTLVRITKAKKAPVAAVEVNKPAKTKRVKAQPKPKKVTATLKDLGLPPRVEALLNEAGVKNPSQLKKMTDTEISEIKGLGPKAVEQIRAALK